jgi:hypothetical protein
MSFENATKFFHACESLQGWDGCKTYVAPGATFEGQCEQLVDVKSVQSYCDWMAAVGSGPLRGCSYTVHSSSFDETSRTAIFLATFHATHSGDGGPVPATNKHTDTDYVYALTLNAEGKVEKMRKVWNAPWALKELGWM